MSEVQIASSDRELEQIFELRYATLRAPWNQPYASSFDALESLSVNAYIEHAGKVIACGRLQDNGNNVGQIRYMAVSPEFRGQGFAKMILQSLEDQARLKGLTTIELQARENAMEFYLSQGYTLKEKTFRLFDVVQHYLMVKQIGG
jgi:N-acetylglutamate synthase-like GNAT family acetyltransferase